jgi:hypothetical protein
MSSQRINNASDLEADQLIALGSDLGYERSADVGTEKLDDTYTNHISAGHTSTNAWCIKECMDDPILQWVMARIPTITGIPEPNSENLQLLRRPVHRQFTVSAYAPMPWPGLYPHKHPRHHGLVQHDQ